MSPLTVVLDLDHTAIHATGNLPSLEELENRWNGLRLPNEDDGEVLWSPVYRIDLGCSYVMRVFWIKVRPGLLRFLKVCKESGYQLAAYTNGSETYAKHIISLLDPDGTYFEGRLVFRSDDIKDGKGNGSKKSMKIMCDEFNIDLARCIIVDDRIDVWPEDHERLIRVRPYFWFEHGTSKVIQLSSHQMQNPYPDDVERELCFRDMDFNQLDTVLNLLHQIAANSLHDAKLSLQKLQKSLFQGKIFAFTGIFRRGIDPTTHPLWKEIERFGGVCVATKSRMTHLVMENNVKTEKYRYAKSNKSVKIVSVSWVLDCICRYKLVPECNHKATIERGTQVSMPSMQDLLQKNHSYESLPGKASVSSAAAPNSMHLPQTVSPQTPQSNPSPAYASISKVPAQTSTIRNELPPEYVEPIRTSYYHAAQFNQNKKLTGKGRNKLWELAQRAKR